MECQAKNSMSGVKLGTNLHTHIKRRKGTYKLVLCIVQFVYSTSSLSVSLFIFLCSSGSTAKSQQPETDSETDPEANTSSVEDCQQRNMEDLSSSDSESATVIKRPKLVTRQPMMRKSTIKTVPNKFLSRRKNKFSENTPNPPTNQSRTLRDVKVRRRERKKELTLEAKVTDTMQKRTLRSSFTNRKTLNTKYYFLRKRTRDKSSNHRSERLLAHLVDDILSKDNEKADGTLKDTQVSAKVSFSTAETPAVDSVCKECHGVPIGTESSCAQDRVYEYSSTEFTDHKEGVFRRETTSPSCPSALTGSNQWIKGQNKKQHPFTTASKMFKEGSTSQTSGDADKTLEDMIVAYKIAEDVLSPSKFPSGAQTGLRSTTVQKPQNTLATELESSPPSKETLHPAEDKGVTPRLSTMSAATTSARRPKRKWDFECALKNSQKLRKTDVLNDKSFPPSEYSPFHKVIPNQVLHNSPSVVPNVLNRSPKHKNITSVSNERHMKESTLDSRLRSKPQASNSMQTLVAVKNPRHLSKGTTGEESITSMGVHDCSADAISLMAVSKEFQQSIESCPLSETENNCSLKADVGNSNKHVSFCESGTFMASPELGFVNKFTTISASLSRFLPLAWNTARSTRPKASKEPVQTAKKTSIDNTTSVDSWTGSIPQTNCELKLPGLVPCYSRLQSNTGCHPSATRHIEHPANETDNENSDSSVSPVYRLNYTSGDSPIQSQSQGPMQQFLSLNLLVESSNDEFVSESDV